MLLAWEGKRRGLVDYTSSWRVISLWGDFTSILRKVGKSAIGRFLEGASKGCAVVAHPAHITPG